MTYRSGRLGTLLFALLMITLLVLNWHYSDPSGQPRWRLENPPPISEREVGRSG